MLRTRLWMGAILVALSVGALVVDQRLARWCPFLLFIVLAMSLLACFELLALLGPDKDDLDRKGEVAEKHGLQLVDGKIPVPDLRVEYETPELELRQVDLELATRDYRPRAMAAKASAGFSMYARSEDASRLRRVLDEREITAEILSL